jgi:hypothetical protein
LFYPAENAEQRLTKSALGFGVERLYREGWNKSRIARELGVDRGAVIGMLK